MKRKSFVILYFLIGSLTSLSAQDCKCISQFEYIVNFYQTNSPAFQKIKNDPDLYRGYSSELKRITKKVRRLGNNDDCILYLDQYVALLKDHHSSIGFNLKRRDISSVELIDAFKTSPEYKMYRKIDVNVPSLLASLDSKPRDGIEGIYSNGSGSISFGIVPDGKARGKFVAVILKKNKLSDVGHILMEMRRIKGNTYDVTYNVGLVGFTFPSIRKPITIENGVIGDFGFSKAMITGKKEYEFKQLSSTVNYLRLSSFDGSIVDKLHAFYDSIAPQIKSKPLLIIDIRNNSGGSENGYSPLLQYAYTKPLKIDEAVVWVTPQNILSFEQQSRQDALVERMKKSKPGTFIPFDESFDFTYEMDSVTANPRKIALIYDRGSASASEGMISYFMQSDKVITIGENSGGFIGYGNVMTTETPCKYFTIQCTTTKYAEKSKYEYVGIPPMHRPDNKDWIEYAQRILTTN